MASVTEAATTASFSLEESRTGLLSNDEPVTAFVIDDDESIQLLLTELLRDHGFSVRGFSDASSALSVLRARDCDCGLIICDLRLPGISGLDLIEELNKNEIDIPLIMVTAHVSLETAVRAVEKGAFDYITKPLNLSEVAIVAKRAVRIKQLERNYIALRESVLESKGRSEIIGRSEKIRALHDLIYKVAGTNSNVLITGESGSGKEVVARAIHKNSKRAGQPFVAINCSAIPKDLLEAELFGYKKGSFTGASENRKGLFQEADGGTLFLDEIGDMSMTLQSKVLRAIQERKVRPVGENSDREIDVRIIAATHKDLKKAIQKQEFREDLYYRLNVIPIGVPALREHKEDIPLLAMHFLRKFSGLNEKHIRGFTNEAMLKLHRIRWTGNVRELENTIERAVVLSTSSLIQEADITIESASELDEKLDRFFSGLVSLDQLEREYFQNDLQKTGSKKPRIFLGSIARLSIARNGITSSDENCLKICFRAGKS